VLAVSTGKLRYQSYVDLWSMWSFATIGCLLGILQWYLMNFSLYG
jgi:membrane protein DedA with SNARE-associated domain